MGKQGIGGTYSTGKAEEPRALGNPIPQQQGQEFLTTGCNALDEFLCGGIPMTGITEGQRRKWSWKNTMCLQLAMTTQLPIRYGGLNGEVVYMSTEKLFPSQRFAELSRHFILTFGDFFPDNPADKVTLAQILETNLSRQNNTAVVVINQVTGTPPKQGEGNKFKSVPSLGPVWTNIVSTRLFMSRARNFRLVTVKFAPHIPVGSFPIILKPEGFQTRAKENLNNNNSNATSCN